MKRRSFFSISAYIVISSLFIVLCAGTVSAEPAYPERPVKVFVPFPAGGATDLAARILSSVIPDFLGQPVVVVDKPGATGSICFDYVRKAKADGYTMMIAAIGTNALYVAMNTKLPFEWDDLAYIARTQINPGVTIVNKKSPWKNFEEFARALKADPSKYKFSTSGVGAIQHLSAALIYKELGIPISKLTVVPFGSGTDGVLAVVRGEVDAWSGNLPEAISSLRGGLVRPLAVTTPERLKDLDQIPTYTELGYPDIDLVGWRGVCGPKALPDEIVKIWEEAVEKTTASKPWLKLIKNIGDEPGYQNAMDFTAFVKKEFTRYRSLFTELGLLVK
jgi:tripartite-type tricarboxylate transporter receptor subunit TctC